MSDDNDFFGSPSPSPRDRDPASPESQSSGGYDNCEREEIDTGAPSMELQAADGIDSSESNTGPQIPGLNEFAYGEISPRTAPPSFRAVNDTILTEPEKAEESVGQLAEQDHGSDNTIDTASASASTVDIEADTERNSPEFKIGESLAVRPPQNGEIIENGVGDGGLLSPSMQSSTSARETLPVEVEIQSEDSDDSDDEGPSTYEKGKWTETDHITPDPSGDSTVSGASARTDDEPVDNRPSSVDEETRALVDRDLEVEILVVKSEEERAAEARSARLEIQALEEDSTPLPPVVAPTRANTSITIATPVISPPVILSGTPPLDANLASAVTIAPPATVDRIPASSSPAERKQIAALISQLKPQADILGEAEPEQDRAQRPTRGLERPVQKAGNPKTFKIVRLIENTDKTGNNIPSAIRLRTHYFDVDFGDFLLDLSGPRAEIAQVRNYAGQERYVPRRMLQDKYQPWDIPATTKVVENGVPLPLMFVREEISADETEGMVPFEEEEPVMVMDELSGDALQRVTATDYERKAGSFTLAHLERKFERPWNILVDKEALKAAWAKKAAPKLPKGKETGKGKKRKRSVDGEHGDVSGEEVGTDDDSAGERLSKKPKTKKATTKKGAKAVVKKDKKGGVIVGDKSTSKKSSGRRLTADSMMDDNFADSEESPIVTTKGKGKRSAAKMITDKGINKTRK
ncbi:hypothetical protein WAI453_007545 [Rhynchosporium graminicola]